MTVQALKKATISQVCIFARSVFAPVLIKTQNGVGAFVLQCHKLSFHYCDWAGSSRGMKYVYPSCLSTCEILIYPVRFSAILSRNSLLQIPKSRWQSPLAHEDTQSLSDITSVDGRRPFVFEIYRRSKSCKRQSYYEMLVERYWRGSRSRWRVSTRVLEVYGVHTMVVVLRSEGRVGVYHMFVHWKGRWGKCQSLGLWVLQVNLRRV